MKNLLFLLLFFFAFGNLKAQIFSSEPCFYLKAGKDFNSSERVWIVYKFKGNKSYVCGWIEQSLSEIRKNLKKDKNYYDNYGIENAQDNLIYEYDSSMLTSSKYVYKRCWEGYRDVWGYTPTGCEYSAFSKDKSTLIRWRENEEEDRILWKDEYIRVDNSKVMPQGINRDFLE
jgi:hypothetical protein